MPSVWGSAHMSILPGSRLILARLVCGEGKGIRPLSARRRRCDLAYVTMMQQLGRFGLGPFPGTVTSHTQSLADSPSPAETANNDARMRLIFLLDTLQRF